MVAPFICIEIGFGSIPNFSTVQPITLAQLGEHHPDTMEVIGSIPMRNTIRSLGVTVAYSFYMRKVEGSNPSGTTNKK